MKKRIFAIVTVCMLLLGMLTACGESGPVNSEQAQKLAIKALGLAADEINEVHTHIIEENGVPCFQIHVSTDHGDLTVVINAATGEVISNG